MTKADAPKYLVATKGFSANGITMVEGEYHDKQFDEQTVKVLVGMGRLVGTDEAPTPGEKKKGKAVVSLPGADT